MVAAIRALPLKTGQSTDRGKDDPKIQRDL
jgi:hypothetical protein